MASVQELKDALVAEQVRTIDVADRALSAISTVTSVSALAIAVLALFMAILGLIGYNRIKSFAREGAEKVAQDRLDSYIGSKEFEQLMERKVAEEAQKRWQNTVVLREFTAPEKQQSEASPFPEKDKNNGDNTG